MTQDGVKPSGGASGGTAGIAAQLRIVFTGLWLALSVAGPFALHHAFTTYDADRSMTARASGVVVGLESVSGGSAGPSTAVPTVRFEVDGKTHEVVSRVTYARDTFQIGQQIPIRYDPTDPSIADLVAADLDREVWIVGILGVLLVLNFVRGVVSRVRAKWFRGKGAAGT
jgi:hypothetical protein